MTIRLAVAPEAEAVGARPAAVLGSFGDAVTVVDGDNALGAVREGRAELAAVPAETLRHPLPGLSVVGALPRGEPRDVLVVRGPAAPSLSALPGGSRVGVAGARRHHLLGVHRPDLVVAPFAARRAPMAAYREGAIDAVVVSAAEARSGPPQARTDLLDPRAWLPAPGQAAVVLVARSGEGPVRDLKGVGVDPATLAALRTEWALIQALGLDVGSRLAALAMVYGRWIRLWATVADADQRRLVRADQTGELARPRELADAVARQLVARGAAEFLP
ncbi:MAG: hypothetical protein RH859_09820 [Longimicrobiales bacterium]